MNSAKNEIKLRLDRRKTSKERGGYLSATLRREQSPRPQQQGRDIDGAGTLLLDLDQYGIGGYPSSRAGDEGRGRVVLCTLAIERMTLRDDLEW